MSGQAPATPSALYTMINIPEAQHIVLAETQALPSVRASLSEAVGAVLAEDINAPEDVPPFPASIKVDATLQSRAVCGSIMCQRHDSTLCSADLCAVSHLHVAAHSHLEHAL